MLCLIVGIPRSGTGWMFELITAHPDAVGLDRQEAYPKDPKKWTSIETGIFDPGSYYTPEMVHELLARKAASSPGKLIVEKTPRHCAFVDRAQEIVPNVKVIAIERDHYAIMESHWRRWPAGSGEVDNIIIAFQAHLDALKGNPAVLFVQYEALVEDTEGQLGLICDHLGLDPAGIPEILSESRDKYKSPEPTGPAPARPQGM